jgi:hypothetical protein
VMWIGLWIWSILTLPIVVYIHVHSTETLELQPGLNLAFATGFVHALYFVVLSFGPSVHLGFVIICLLNTLGYSIGDVSVVYPIGRGSAVAISAVVEAFFLTNYFPTQNISFNGWIGRIASSSRIPIFPKLFPLFLAMIVFGS